MSTTLARGDLATGPIAAVAAGSRNTMIRTTLIALIVLVAACGASNPKTAAAARGEECSRWDGEPCSRDTQCCSLWCVNGGCARREP